MIYTPDRGLYHPNWAVKFMEIASQNQAQNFYFSVKYLLGIVDIYSIGKNNPRRMKNDDYLHDFWNDGWFRGIR